MRAKLTIGPEGQISLPPRQAEALGLGGGGDVDLVLARGEFALLVPARPEGPTACFAGSLSSLTVAEVVQLVFASLKTGVLLLAVGKEGEGPPDEPEQLRRKSIYFRDGQVVFASSSNPQDRLGPVLAALGLVARGDLERASKLVRSGRPLGQVLVDEGVLTSGQLYDAIVHQVRAIFLGAFRETTGEFAFLEGPLDELNQVKLPERTRDLILEAMKGLDTADDREAPPRGTGRSGPAGGGRAPGGAGSALDADARVAARAAAASPAPPRDPVPSAAGPFEIYRRIFRRVHAALAAVEGDAAARLNSYFERVPATKRSVFAGVRFGEDGEMDVARVLANVTASRAYPGAASRARSLEALEELLAFALFEAKNRLPRADAERLLREVGRMQVGGA